MAKAIFCNNCNASIAANVLDALHDQRDGVVVRACASQSADPKFIALVESYQKTVKNSIHSFPAWRSEFRENWREQAGKLCP